VHPCLRPPTWSQGRPVATSHSAQLAAELLNQPSAPIPSLTAAAIKLHNALPSHAFWTVHSRMNATTGASLEYSQLQPSATDQTWLHDTYAATPPDTGAVVEFSKLRNSSDGTEWVAAAADEIGRLAQGNLSHILKGTDTIYFIPVLAIPQGRQAAYWKIVASGTKPHKVNKRRARFTVDGD
jgi:hypothetical protein